MNLEEIKRVKVRAEGLISQAFQVARVADTKQNREGLWIQAQMLEEALAELEVK